MYSQYPIDFPSAASHAYSVSGVSQQFASPDVYNPTALGTHTHQHEIIQPSDATAQQSQQAPTLQLINNTRATERWDGKSRFRKLLDPIIESVRQIIDPIATVVFDATATFRGRNTDTTVTKTNDEQIKKPREILVPQPRNIAQRKMNRRKNLPKKYSNLKVDLNRLKHNKDFYEYIKTKKYKHNYPNTYYYPRIKYIVDPNIFLLKPNNSRLVPYRKETQLTLTPTEQSFILNETEWKPIINLNQTIPDKYNNQKHFKNNLSNKTRFRRNKRSLRLYEEKTSKFRNTSLNDHRRNIKDSNEGRGIVVYLLYTLFRNIFPGIVNNPEEHINDTRKQELKPESESSVPEYYRVVYDILMTTLEIIDGFVNAEEVVDEELLSENNITNNPKKKKFKKKKVVKNKTAPKCPQTSNKITDNDETIENTGTEIIDTS